MSPRKKVRALEILRAKGPNGILRARAQMACGFFCPNTGWEKPVFRVHSMVDCEKYFQVCPLYTVKFYLFQNVKQKV